MSGNQADLGVLGMGTMGASLALNFADNGGFTVALGNRTTEKAYGVRDENPALADRLVPTDSIEHFVGVLKSPRVVVLMVNAGKPVDDQMALVLPHLALPITLERALAAATTSSNSPSPASGSA